MPHSTTPKSLITKIAHKKLTRYAADLGALKDLTDLGNPDNNTSQDYAGRFAFELLQNGADAHAEGAEEDPSRYAPNGGRVCFIQSGRFLVVANTGIPFSHEPRKRADGDDREPVSSLESITRLGESTKSFGKFIGNKGIGFKSIYQICNRLWLISGGYQVLFDGEETWNRLVDELRGREGAEADACRHYLQDRKGKIPMLKVGFWFDEPPEEIAPHISRLGDDRFDTILILEQKANGGAALSVSPDFIRRRLADLGGKEVLFLDTLSEVRCEYPDFPERDFIYRLRRTGDNNRAVIRQSPDGDREHRFLSVSLPIASIRQPARIAFSLSDGVPVRAEPGDRVFYTFYPAVREAHGFPFFIHSYFRLSPNREYFNGEGADRVAHNKDRLTEIADGLINRVIPELKARFPNRFLPEILLPEPDETLRQRIEELGKEPDPDAPDFNFLSRTGGLSAWFARRAVNGLATADLVRDIAGRWRALRDVRFVEDDVAAAAADVVFGRLAQGADSTALPPGLIARNADLRPRLAPLKPILRDFPEPLTVDDLASALEAADSALAFSDREAAALAVLLRRLSGGDPDALARAAERIRQTRLPVLPCEGEDHARPLPQIPQANRPLRAASDAPLIFYRPTRAERNLTEDAETEASEDVQEAGLPAFCHVHVLRRSVFSAFPETPADEIRTIFKEDLGLRPFTPQEVFVRMAEAALGESEGTAPLLTPDAPEENLQTFLETTLHLVRGRRLAPAARDRSSRPDVWFMKNREDSDWKLFYYLARSVIPMKDRWVPGREVILAGGFSERGETIRQSGLYDGVHQVFLTEENEADWLAARFNAIHDDHAPTDDRGNAAARRRFRAYAYRLLGAWDGLRLDVVFHPGGYEIHLSEDAPAPHPCLQGHEWRTWIRIAPSPWTSFSLSGCFLRNSAAIPHLEGMADQGGDAREVLMESLKAALPRIDALRRIPVWSGGGSTRSRGETDSYLLRQLQSFPWVPPAWERDTPSDGPVWFTRKRIDARTHKGQSAHYLRSVSALQMDEALARAVGLPILEEASPAHLDDFLTLYEALCQRVERADDPGPGAGFPALYRQAASQIQKILEDHRSAIGDAGLDAAVQTVKDAGVICMTRADAGGGKGLTLEKDLSRVLFDDGGESPPVFREMLRMAALDSEHRRLADRLGLRRLSDADIVYDDGKNDRFEGYEAEEEEIKDHLKALGPSLFAFRAHAAFIPEGQRLEVRGEQFKRLWEAFDRTKVEIVHTLRISVDGGEPEEISDRYPVVLEHSRKGAGSPPPHRRLFIHHHCLRDGGDIHYPHLARPLAILIGAEAHAIAVEMLLMQYFRGEDIADVHRYLEEQCGVPFISVQDIEDADADRRALRERRLDELTAMVRDAVGSRFPERALNPDQERELREILSGEMWVESPAVLGFLQNRLGLELHALAEDLDLDPFQDNRARFNNLKQVFREKALAGAALNGGIDTPDAAWEDLRRDYETLPLPEPLQYRFRPADGDIFGPLREWMADHGVLVADENDFQRSDAEAARWRLLNPPGAPAEPDAGAADAYAAFIPYIIALCRRHSTFSTAELLDALDDSGLNRSALAEDAPDEIRDRFEMFLTKRRAPREAVDALFARWPKFDPDSLPDIDAGALEGVKREIQKYREGQRAQTRRRARWYNRYIREAIQENPGLLTPVGIRFTEPPAAPQEPPAPVADPASPVSAMAGPKPVGRRKVSESDYLAADFQNRAVGRCAEEYALEVQRARWAGAIRNGKDDLPGLLGEIESRYRPEDLNNPENKNWREALGRLKGLGPEGWDIDRDWIDLRRLLHMAEWSPAAGYDILGLDRENDGEPWRIYRIEVKGSRQKHRLDFPISSGELAAAKQDGAGYVIWRVNNVDPNRKPAFFRLPDPQRLIRKNRLQATADVTILRVNGEKKGDSSCAKG